MGLNDDLTLLAKQKLSAVFEDREYLELEGLLRGEGVFGKNVSRDLFATEYLALKLALAAHSWEHQCRENHVGEEDSRKLFFRMVMQCFKGEKMVSLAAAFSEYYYSAESEEEGNISVVLGGRLFTRLGAKRPGGQVLIETLEGFRSAFETKLTDFFLSRL